MRLIPLLIAFFACSAFSQTLFTGKVVEILDGDNLAIQTAGNRKTKIRLAGIDAPETDQAFGPEAATELSKLVLNRDIQYHTFKIDSLSRYVAKVTIGDLDIAYELVKSGNAWHNGEKSETSTANLQAYSVAQEDARQKKSGLWASENPKEPWIWSRGMRMPAISDLPKVAPRAVDYSKAVIGVAATRLYYRPGCGEVGYQLGVSHQTFYSEQEAIDAGYRKADKCTTPSTDDSSGGGGGSRGGGGSATPLRTAKAIKIIQVTSDVDSYIGKLVTFEGEISMSTSFAAFDSGIAYAFEIADSTDSILGYTPKSSGSARLRSLLLSRSDPTARAKVRVKILEGSTPNYTYGVLVDFVLYGQR